ncbi:thioredoxin-dependent thiol peroxidase [Nakamurella sp. PAMC28650]|jgi:peroxiredoxin Q/BCP|uniref:thioredoxin-dependent thiol peroxidase n=1 Tax=Nakamurella sp. PAMC28650 TaxID=2762325 RepID=UPI00164E3140|nr:thioredoxin-dependent thiol peroxidase [Nakamurella sp. PAMC28650]QNK80539.1 thioredoxin-dependent thiol peroxidase [Nakamurella sp. PAMC28650]
MTTKLPDVGDAAPDFTLSDAAGAKVSLADFTGQNVILYFYPAAMTPGCTTEACDFSAAKPELDTAGYIVLGVSPDAPSKLAAFTEKSGLDVVLLSDPEREVLTAYGAYGEKQNYGRTVMGVIRSTFVIGPDGRITKAWRNVKATGHVARVLKEIGLAG